MVNLDWEFLGIPNHNNFGSKNLEIPRNSQKFQVYSQHDLEFLGIPWNSWEFLGIPNHNNFGSKNLEIPRNSQKFTFWALDFTCSIT